MKHVIPKSMDCRDMLGHVNVHILDHFGAMGDLVLFDCPINYNLKLEVIKKIQKEMTSIGSKELNK